MFEEINTGFPFRNIACSCLLNEFEFFVLFGLCYASCGILVTQSGNEPVPLAVEAQSPNHWTTREVPEFKF